MLDQYLPITDIYAREIIDSRGNPSIEVEALAGGLYTGRVTVPSGSMAGRRGAAVELRDGEDRYGGWGVQQAVENVNARIAPELVGMNALEQVCIDRTLLRLDGTPDKRNMGANAVLGVSAAVAKAAAAALRIPLYAYLGGAAVRNIPVPAMTMLEGGGSTLDLKEYMILPAGACCCREGIRMCSEIYHSLEEILRRGGHKTAVGHEGGFVPDLKDTRQALELIMEAILAAGCTPGEEIRMALHVSAERLYDRKIRKYCFAGETKMHGHKVERSREELMEYYEELADDFPVAFIEDPLDGDDREGWEQLTERLEGKVCVTGDGFFTGSDRGLQKSIKERTAGGLVIRPGQIGTVTEIAERMEKARQAGCQLVLSQRSGETEDAFGADLAVAFRARILKAGAPCRSERTAKYNQLLRIEEKLGEAAAYGC